MHCIKVFMEERQRLLLIRQNPWWKNKKIKLPTFERDLFKKLQPYIKYNQILAIVGLRRVGKTILMKQIIQKLKSDNNNICYISFDDIDFQKYEVAENLINYFLEYSNKKEMRYLFLDEIQKLPNWADLLKVYYDTEEKLKIIISGSASLELNINKETLAGRILTFHLPILTFKEFTRYFNMEISIDSKDFLREYDLKFSDKQEKYQEIFQKYILKGAFPELLDINIEESEYIKKYIKESVIEKSIFDISRITKEDEKIIYDLFKLLANSNARLFEIMNISNILKINRNKTSKYINLLEKTFLITISYNFTASVAKQIRTSKKQYAAHSSIVISLLDYPFEIINTELIGHLIEGIIANIIEKVSFWRTPQKNEVDIVTKDKTPIEVKYKARITNNDINFVIKFCEKFKIKNGIVITKDIIEKRKINDIEITLIPAWFFLLYWDKR